MIYIEKNNMDEILNYIGNEYNKSPYLYIDLIKYGFSNNNVTTYIQRNEKNDSIQCVVLCYYTGMHIFSKNLDFNIDEIVNLIKETKPAIVCAEKEIILKLSDKLKNYSNKFGYVRELKKENNIDYIHKVTKATIDDIKDVARLLNADEDLGKSYKDDELYMQLIERNKDGFSRNYVIKENNKVISHAASSGETEKVAMLSGVITDPKYRGMGYAYEVTSKLCSDLLNEGKRVYLINYTYESTKLYDKIGFEISVEFGKLVLNKN